MAVTEKLHSGETPDPEKYEDNTLKPGQNTFSLFSTAALDSSLINMEIIISNEFNVLWAIIT